MEPQAMLSAQLPYLDKGVVGSQDGCSGTCIHIEWGISFTLCSEDGFLEF